MRDAIIVQGLSKEFHRYPANRPRTLKERFVRGWWHRGSIERFWALQDVSFNIAPGRMVGVIGRNGAGKSTLLRLVGGVGRPDRGSLKVHGRINAILDLGAGFHPDLTGRENVFVSGVIAGLTHREIRRRFDSIVAFAELRAFIDNPLRTYSTGMQMRLAFAVAVHTEPEVLLIDEVLSVGDIAFQRKCLERIAKFKAEGCAIVLVSHEPGQIQELCDEVLWLRAGQLMAHGETGIVVGQYVAEMTAETQRRTPDRTPQLTTMGTQLRINVNRFGSLELEIIAVRLLNQHGFPITELDSGEPLQVEIEYLASQPLEAPIFSVTISREDGMVCYDTSTAAMGLALPMLQGQGHIMLHVERLDLSGEQYYVDVGVYERDWAYAYDYHWHVYPLQVRATGSRKGILCLPHYWEVGKAHSLVSPQI